LARFGYEDHAAPAYLQCFDENELRRIRHQLGCRLKLVQLIGEDDWSPEPTNFAAMRTKKGLAMLSGTVDGVGPWFNRLYKHRKRDGRISDSGFVARAHEQGLVVHPYTFRSDAMPPGFDSFDELLDFGINELALDGLFTDFPDYVF
jgi:glycerophosphoryl diester phosphodiesterase